MPYTSASPTQPRVRVTVSDIPDDIWRIIAGHVSQSTVPRIHPMERYMAVNRSFYNYVLDKKYGEVRWIKADWKFVMTLRRLRDPLIAQRVQRLFIRAWFIEYLLQQHLNTPVTERAKTLMESSLNSVMSKFGKEAPFKWPSAKEMIKSLTTAVQGMTNVVEFNFEWRDLPLNKDTRILLTSTRSAFYTSLRKLVLRAQISKFKELLAITDYANIDELDFHFDYRVSDAKNAVQAQPTDEKALSENLPVRDPDLMSTIFPFINHRRSSLRSLAISSSSTVDLAEFFNALPSESLTSLRRFRVQISFNEKTLSDPSGILRILKARATSLRHVSLLPNWPEQVSGAMERTDIYKQKREEWTRTNDELLSQSTYLSNLESLELPFVSIAETIPFLHRSGDTLTRLCLVDNYLSTNEVTEVVSVFRHRPFELQHLHLEVAILDLPLIQLLANSLPGLFSLVLVFNSFTYFLEFEESEGRIIAVLQDWKLYELAVYEKRYRSQSPDIHSSYLGTRSHSTEEQIMRRFLVLVPSICVLMNVQMRDSDGSMR